MEQVSACARRGPAPGRGGERGASSRTAHGGGGASRTNTSSRAQGLGAGAPPGGTRVTSMRAAAAARGRGWRAPNPARIRRSGELSSQAPAPGPMRTCSRTSWAGRAPAEVLQEQARAQEATRPRRQADEHAVAFSRGSTTAPGRRPPPRARCRAPRRRWSFPPALAVPQQLREAPSGEQGGQSRRILCRCAAQFPGSLVSGNAGRV